MLGKCNSDMASKTEIEYIAKYNSYYNGYNSTLGGEGSLKIEYNEDEILDLYNCGNSIHYIMNKLGVHSSRVISEIIKANGITVEKQTPIIVEQYTMDNKLLRVFSSKNDAHKWLI